MKPSDIFRDCANILEARGEQYGSPKPLYQRTARLLGLERPEDACMALAKVKIARIEEGVEGEALADSYIDAINYLALAYFLEKNNV